MNPKLNISEVVSCFPGKLESIPDKPIYNLTSPFDVALRENQIRAAQAEVSMGTKIPAHYFVYAQGQPTSREQSRIGGLPYRPRGLEWPKSCDGQPMEFVCQVDFSDSRSILPSLPGDIMLLFASDNGGDGNGFPLEWYPSGLTNLVEEGDLPKFNLFFPMVREPVYCHLYETNDYPEATGRFKGTKFEQWKTLASPCGSKIAGFHKEAIDGSTHIFTLETIRLYTRDPYPFANRRDWKPTSTALRFCSDVTGAIRRLLQKPERYRCYDVLMIGDAGNISVFKEPNGQFRVSDFSY